MAVCYPRHDDPIIVTVCSFNVVRTRLAEAHRQTAMLESQPKSSRLLHQYNCQCRPTSPLIIVHLPHLCLIEAVHLRIDPESSEPLPKIRIGQESFVDAVSDGDSLLYPVRSATTTLSVVYGFVCDRPMTVSVYGYDLTESPDKSQLIDLLNLSAWFRQRSLWQNVIITDLLCGLALIDSRSFLQASEIFQSAAILLEQHGPDETRTTICSRESLLLLSAATFFPTAKTDRLLQILGDISGQPMSMSDLHRSAKIEPLVDAVGPMLAHSLPYVRQAASRALEFLLETIGCDCVPMMDTIVASLLMAHDADLVEPVLVASITNLFLMTPGAVQALVETVFEPALHQALAYSISDCSIATVLRLILAAFHRLKWDMEMRQEMIADVMECSQERYSHTHWVVDQVWVMIISYIPDTQYQAEILDLCAEMISIDNTPTDYVRRSLQLIIRIAAVNLERATGDGPRPVQYDLVGLIDRLTIMIMSELERGDQIHMDLFQMYWEALILVIALHNAIVTTSANHIVSIDRIATPIVEAGVQMLRHGSPKTPLLQVLRQVVPALEPSSGLMVLLMRILVWLPDCVQDAMFDLIHVLIVKLRPRLSCDQIRDLVWIWSNRSTARSQLADRCRTLVQEIVIQTGTLSYLFQGLVDIKDPVRRRDLLQFVLEAVEVADHCSVLRLDMVTIASCLRSMLMDNDLRHLCLQILKQIISTPQVALDSAVILAVLDVAEADPNPPTQFAIAELLGTMMTLRPWPCPIIERTWIWLQALAIDTNWNNVRRIAFWASLNLTRSHFSSDNLDQAWRAGPAEPWHEAIAESCGRHACAETRLWGLKLIWALAFRSPAVLRSAPSSISDLIVAARFDSNDDVRLAATLLTDIISGRGEDVDYENILAVGSPPSSLMEMSITVPDLTPCPLKSTPSSPERDLDVGSDLSEGIPTSGLPDDDVDVDDNDGLCQGEAMRSAYRPIETLSEMDDEVGSRPNQALMNKNKVQGKDREFPGKSDLVDLSLIELQWIDD